MSVDGKISSGDSDELDVDKDWKKISGVKEGLNQYYALEQETDLFSLNSGRTWEKIGFNSRTDQPPKLPVSFIVIDNKPHLTKAGVEYAAKKGNKLFLVTTNSAHPAFELRKVNRDIETIHYPGNIDLAGLMQKLKQDYGVDRLTIQTGGNINAVLMRNNLIDHLSIVVAPLMVGGRSTPSLMDGESLHSQNDLLQLRALRLKTCRTLENSYLHLEYDVVHEAKID